MKKKGLKKNTFIQGTLIASISMIFIKVIGAIYVVPFYAIIGESGGTLYSYAYSIYNLFLNISTAGVPIAMSMIISEYLTLNMYDAKERAYKIGKKMIFALSFVAFLIVFLGSSLLAKFILSDVTGGHTIKEVSLVIKAIAPCLLIIPFLSVLRGYMQGHKFISPTSFAQVIEQVVRILIVIFGALIAKQFFSEISPVVAIALTGTFFGGLISYLYLRKKVKDNKKEFPLSEKRDGVKDKTIAKKILAYCLPIVLISITDNIYTLVDIKLIIKGLNMIGYDAMSAEIISGVVSTWAPKICSIIMTISLALTTNIIPHVTSNFIKKDYKGVNYRVNQAMSTILIITVPMSLLLLMLSGEAYYLFYGSSNYGSLILKASAISHTFLGIWTVLSSSLQGMQKFKVIYKNSFIGIITNALLDIPLILLFNKIGVSPYIATVVATSVGYTTSIILSLRYLKKTMRFEYDKTFNILKKIILPCICMILPIIVGKQLITYNITTLTSFITLGVYGLIGMLIYLFMTYKNNSLQEVLGEDLINNVLKKLHLKK